MQFFKCINEYPNESKSITFKLSLWFLGSEHIYESLTHLIIVVFVTSEKYFCKSYYVCDLQPELNTMP